MRLTVLQNFVHYCQVQVKAALQSDRIRLAVLHIFVHYCQVEVNSTMIHNQSVPNRATKFSLV